MCSELNIEIVSTRSFPEMRKEVIVWWHLAYAATTADMVIVLQNHWHQL
jgi:broad-specificity NMP kinase